MSYDPGLSPLYDVHDHREAYLAELVSLSQNVAATQQISERRILVEPDGIEPTTSCLQSTRSPS